ncbi:aminoacetone oxidase family FAD-binding enzyme [Sulfurimonas sp. HSL-3221]|uniref:NAD(P)/FAD-dependent oxidoreductase n=1 Tax=Thiomicrolovo sulfuroxydans TaxID=2894755 RepID=UPI001E3BD40D|nr:aminoacetone oxidase family FAD-binding enzyme [Sulfurimonas sp. HSL-3221]UFS63103.1 aminoacetone oxidase family FAD-binding enzyme [Sulfurimonas sp. HSL-3221]
MEFDVAILGSGAAGLMAAARLSERGGLSVCVVEGNAKPGAKIRISGGGKCNLTNVSVSENNYLGDETLVRSVLKRFDEHALLKWVRMRGCEPVVRKARYYFCPRSAQELIDILIKSAEGVRFFLGHRIETVRQKENGFIVTTDKTTLKARNVIVATGGVSYASVGATDIGLKIAESFGIETVPFRPALAGMTLQKEQFWMKALTGISFPVTIHVSEKRLREDMLFAHRGISGPAVLSASLYWEKGTITIDFLDGLSVEEVLKRGGNKKIATAIPLPKRFVTAFLDMLGVADKPCSTVTAEEKVMLKTLSTYTFAPAGTFGFTKAEVSKGGVACSALKPYSCESRGVRGLYFVGEVVDVTGELGGYNFQWAFASGRCAADHIWAV